MLAIAEIIQDVLSLPLTDRTYLAEKSVAGRHRSLKGGAASSPPI
jgi:hypothetical protein